MKFGEMGQLKTSLGITLEKKSSLVSKIIFSLKITLIEIKNFLDIQPEKTKTKFITFFSPNFLFNPIKISQEFLFFLREYCNN